jgi:peptidoglycan/xylan/chitin deacetylase (PgdA/CDA1 family)
MPEATVCITYDFDGVSPWIWTYKKPYSHKLGVFGADVGVPRLLDVQDRHEVPSTWFIPGHTIESFPEASEEIYARGHEIQHHGWSHAPRRAFTSRYEEKNDLERGIQVIRELTGKDPTGFRAPAGGFSKHTIGLLRGYDFEWTSSDKERDFEPYYLRKGWELSESEPYERGEKTELVEIPIQWQRDDWLQTGPVVSSLSPNAAATRGSMMSDASVFDRLQNEFDWMYENVEDGLFVMLLHPQISGRATMVDRFDNLLQHMRERPDVQFADASTVAEEFRTRVDR